MGSNIDSTVKAGSMDADPESHWRNSPGVWVELPGGIQCRKPQAQAEGVGGVCPDDSGWGAVVLGLSPGRQGWNRSYGLSSFWGWADPTDDVPAMVATLDDKAIPLGVSAIPALCGIVCGDRHLPGNYEGGGGAGDLPGTAEGVAELCGAALRAF